MEDERTLRSEARLLRQLASEASELSRASLEAAAEALEAKADSLAAAAPPVTAHAASRVQILIVDDDPAFLELADAVLSRAGYATTADASGDDALARLSSGWPADVLFTDIVMPGTLDGIELAAKAKHLRPDLAVLYATGYRGVHETIDRSKLFGPVIAKPYRPHHLVQMVTDLVREHACPVSVGGEGGCGGTS